MRLVRHSVESGASIGTCAGSVWKAEDQCKEGDIDADATVDKALLALQERYYFRLSVRLIHHALPCLSTGAVPTTYESALIMTGWMKLRLGSHEPAPYRFKNG